MKDRFKSLFFMLVIPLVMTAQSLPDMMLEKNFLTQVKSIDEFIQRFNGNESDATDSIGRIRDLIALFDYRMPKENVADSVFKQNILDFVNCIEKHNIKIQLTDADMYAEVKSKATVLGKDIDLTLILQSQNYGKTTSPLFAFESFG